MSANKRRFFAIMLLAMRPKDRANRIAYNACLRRVGDFGFRAAATRGALEIVMLITVLVTGAHWLNLVGIGVAMLGTYLSLSDNYFTDHDGEPWEPVARYSYNWAVSGIGQNKTYLSGIVEAIAYIPLMAVGPWGMIGLPDAARLLCVACAVGFVASCIGAIFVDAAFYNPDVPFPRFVEFVRASVGFIAAALSAVVVLSAGWTELSWWIAAGLCASLMLVQLRIRETDRAFAAARGFADNEQIEGRQAITGLLHSMVGTPLSALHTAMGRFRVEDPQLYDSFRTVEGGYRQLLSMDVTADVDVDWPGQLAAHLLALGGEYAIAFSFNHPDGPMSRQDRVLAHLILDDLANNAAKSGASRCDIRLERTSDGYIATAADDGRPIVNEQWLREGGGLQRLNNNLTGHGGGIHYDNAATDGGKRVIAHWVSASSSREDDMTAG